MLEFETLEALINGREIKKAEILIARLLRSVQTIRDESTLLIYRARLRLMSARPGESLDDLKTAGISDDKPIVPELLELMGDCYLSRFEIAPAGFANRNDVQQAHDIYSKIATDFPFYENLGWVYYQHGRVCLILDQVNEAQRYFHDALFNPSSITALTAYCYERLGYIAFYESRQPRQAITLLNKAIDTFPPVESRLWCVQAHLLRSRVMADSLPDIAIDAARTALKIASDESPPARSAQAEALFALAELLFRQKNHTETIAVLHQFFQVSKSPQGIDVTWSRAYEMLGDSSYALERYENALTAYQNVLTFNPYHPWEETVQYRIARCYYDLKAFNKAVGTITALLNKAQAENNPIKDYRLYHLLGDACFALSDYRQSSQAYHTALQIAPAGTDISLIRSYYEQSQGISSSPVQL